MPISTETRSFCDVCVRMIPATITSHSTDVAVCEHCLKEFEVYKIQFPEATLREFVAIKKSI